MALYQPSNITPSTFAGIGAGVIDAADNISISWQVNGTSAMTGYTITVYENTTASRQVWEIDSTSAFQPFYGTDAQGNPVLFVCEPGFTWASQGLSNGNSYKMKITQNWADGSTTKSVVQTSESVFITRAAPSLSVSPGSGTLSSVAQTFTASYSQAQGDAVSWVRWVLSDASGNVLDDTGTVYTGVLSYSYDGFFTGQTYSLRCTVQTSSGAEVSVVTEYAVSYETAEQAGGISLSCNPDDSVTLSWAAGADIPGVPSAEDYGSLSGGVLHLAAERSIEWNTVNGQPMAFSSPYCFAWRGRIAETVTETETVDSGTWELWKTYPESRTQDASHTTNAGAWVSNPSAQTTRSRSKTVSVSVNLAHQNQSLWSTDRVLINSIVPSGSYTYKTSIPASVTIDKDILSFVISSVYYVDPTSGLIQLTDAYCEGEKVGDRTVSVTVYTNTQAAYEKEVMVTLDLYYAEYYTGQVTESAESGDTGVTNPAITYYDSRLTSATIRQSGTNFIISCRADSKGTYTVTYRYDYTVSPNNLYMAKWGGSITGGTLVSASVLSTTAAGGAVVSVNRNISGQSVQNAYAVTVYNGNNTSTASTTVRLVYTVQVTGTDSYRSVVTGTKPGATSASIQSTTATRATVTLASDGTYTVTMYYSSGTAREAVVAFTMPQVIEANNLVSISDGTTTQVIGTTNTGTPSVLFGYPPGGVIRADDIELPGSIASSSGANTPSGNSTRCRVPEFRYLYAGSRILMPDSNTWRFAVYYYTSDNVASFVNMPHALTAQDGEYVIQNSGWYRFVFARANNGTLADSDKELIAEAVSIDTTIASVPIPVGAWSILAVVRTGEMDVRFYNGGGTLVGEESVSFAAPLPSPVSSVVLNGEQWCDYVYISQNASYDFASSEPGWDGSTLFYAAFASDLQAGTVGSDDSLSVAIYRQEGTVLSPIGIFGSGVKSIRDYGIRSGAEYVYEMFYITGGAYSAGAESAPMCRQFRQHTLIEAEEDEELVGVYHPVNVWRFRDNVDAGAYTNQNQPVLLENFTKYPLWQPSSPAAKSGTLTALLGRFENGVYSGDDAEAMEALFALSGSVNPLFYRDMKGNLYMVRLAGPISQTVNNVSGMLEVSVSVPWVEVGDAGDVKIYTEG